MHGRKRDLVTRAVWPVMRDGEEKEKRSALTRLSTHLTGTTGDQLNSVAKATGVSKAYLYSQPDQRERIEAFRHSK